DVDLVEVAEIGDSDLVSAHGTTSAERGRPSRNRLEQPLDPAERLGEPGREANRVGAVDHAMIVRQRQRQHQTRHELAVLIDRTPLAARDAEDRDLRRIDDRREERAADAAEARDGEYAALHLVGLELPFAGPRAQLAEL